MVHRRWLHWLVLGSLAVGTGRAVYVQAIEPLRKQEAVARDAVAGLRVLIDGAHQTIRDTQAQARVAEGARGEMERLQKDVPTGPAMIWLPELVKKHFARSGLAVSVIRLNTTVDEPDLPDYQRGYWSMAVPIDAEPKRVTAVLFAAAELEPAYPFLRVLDFAIGPDPEDPEARVATLNLTTLIKN